MGLLTDAADKRHTAVADGQEFMLDDPSLPEADRKLRTLDDLSEAINLISPEVFQRHVNEEKNDFANWVQHVFGEVDLGESLRRFPTPLRMMVSIEKFLRLAEVTPATTPTTTATPASEEPAKSPVKIPVEGPAQPDHA